MGENELIINSKEAKNLHMKRKNHSTQSGCSEVDILRVHSHNININYKYCDMLKKVGETGVDK